MKKQPKQTARDAETTQTIAQDVYALTIRAIRDEIRSLLSGKSKPKGDFTVVETCAYLTKQASTFAAEQRKAEKSDMDAIRKLSPATMLAWVKAQTPEYRARLVRDIAAMDATERRSVLS